MPTTTKFDDTRFRTLLHRWNHHQALRGAGAEISSLAASRVLLDSARLAAYAR